MKLHLSSLRIAGLSEIAHRGIEISFLKESILKTNCSTFQRMSQFKRANTFKISYRLSISRACSLLGIHLSNMAEV